ncbi:MAG: hypothetical protein ABJA82_00695, partial [Myxococcales bacterium]
HRGSLGTRRTGRTCFVGQVPPRLDIPVNLTAVVYREKNLGDLIGYLQAIADALESAEVVTNDRLIVSFDGSRMLKDPSRPRVEITIEPVT